MLHDSLSGTAKKDMLQSRAPMGRRYDQIGRDLLRNTADFIERGPAAATAAEEGGEE